MVKGKSPFGSFPFPLVYTQEKMKKNEKLIKFWTGVAY